MILFLLLCSITNRQQLEQRCSVLKHELEQSDARANELDQELFEARVQITKVSNELYSRRSTTVEDAEIIFAEEVQRVEAKARRDNDDLREEAGTLRTALERKTSLYEEACSERSVKQENVNNDLITLSREMCSSYHSSEGPGVRFVSLLFRFLRNVSSFRTKTCGIRTSQEM